MRENITEPSSSIVLGAWTEGINNRLPKFALSPKQLRSAVNVDIDYGGNVRRRAGYTQIYSGVNLHSAYSCPAGVFFIEAHQLKRLNSDNTATLLSSGWGKTTYEFFNDIVYLSDDTHTAKIVNGAVEPWGVDVHLADDSEYMPMPPCSIIRQYNGRLYGVADKVMWFTNPYELGSVHRHRNFLQFTSPVTILEPVVDGLWVVSDKTYFYAGGGPDEFVVKPMLNYGAVSGTSYRHRDGRVFWTSVKGVVMAANSGEIKNLSEENVAMDTGTDGVSVIREENGLIQFVTAINSPTPSPLAATDWIEMEIARKETP